MTEAVGLPEQRVTTRTYDPYGQCLTTTLKGATAAEDATTTYGYDGFGNVAASTDPLNNLSQYTFDVIGNMVAKRDPRGNVWNKTYNAKGWMLTQTDPLGHATSFAYDRVGNRTRISDALNFTKAYTYNKNNWLVTFSDQLNGVTQFQYDQEGRKTKATDPSGVSVAFEYDSDGRPTRVTDANGNVTQTVYGNDSDGLNGLVAAINFPTYIERYRYDQRNRIAQIIQVLDTNTTYTAARAYDAKGNMVSRTDPAGRSIFSNYDALNRGIRVTDAIGGFTSYEYDNRNNRVAVSDANGNTTRYAFDLADRMAKETRPMGEITRYFYDSVGNLVGRASATGDERHFAYDAANRRTTELQFAMTGGTLSPIPSRTISYAFDSRNLLAGYDDGISSSTILYDAKGYQTDETINYGAFSKTIRYVYRANGTKAEFVYPDKAAIVYGYDANNQLKSISTPLGTIDYIAYQWKVPTQVLSPGVTKTLTFDGLLRPIGISVKANGGGTPGSPQGPVLMDFSYQYNNAGDIVQRTTDEGNYIYQYDALDRLVAAIPPAPLQSSTGNPLGLPVEGYSYDAVHNRVASLHQPGLWAYNGNNQLIQYGQGAEQTNFKYDANGHTVQWTTGGDVRHLEYDVGERLTGLRDTTGAPVAAYYYDPMGRRLKKVVGGTTTYFQYAEEGLIAEYDVSGNMTAAYGWRPDGAWGTDAQFKIEGTRIAFYHNDHLGTAQRLTDVSASVIWSAKSEAFGRTTIDKAVIANPLRLPGQYFDPESSTHYNFFRDYDPGVGRYVESDPVGLRGNINTYGYAVANPIQNTDRKGLWPYYGFWCGPDWTGGKHGPYTPGGGYRDPIDDLDAGCKRHDICYYECRRDFPCDTDKRGGCMTRCDRQLADDAKGAGSWIDSPLYWWMSQNSSPDYGPDDPKCFQCFINWAPQPPFDDRPTPPTF